MLATRKEAAGNSPLNRKRSYWCSAAIDYSGGKPFLSCKRGMPLDPGNEFKFSS